MPRRSPVFFSLPPSSSKDDARSFAAHLLKLEGNPPETLCPSTLVLIIFDFD